MPRYHFHIKDGVDLPDLEGTVLPGVKAAQEEAVRLAGATIADRAKTSQLGEDWAMEVSDETGLVLFRLDFFVSAAAATMGSEWKKDV